MYYQLDIHDEREQNKIGLETYFLNKTNMFDTAIDKLINELKAGILTSQGQLDGWQKLKETDPERYAEQSEQAERHDINIDHQQYETFLDIFYNEEQLLALVEMKVIYAFKFFEINIKKLLMAAFSLQSTKDFYKWENLIKFLKEKNIDVKKFRGYTDISQLKNVNNAIKHSDNYEKSLTTIEEFKVSDTFTYNEIDHFYNRVSNAPNTFLQELITAIHNELYVFDDKKIEGIARSFVLRMTKDEASKLTNKINEYYG